MHERAAVALRRVRLLPGGDALPFVGSAGHTDAMSARALPWLLIPLAGTAGFLLGRASVETADDAARRAPEARSRTGAEPLVRDATTPVARVDAAAPRRRRPRVGEELPPLPAPTGTAPWRAEEQVSRLSPSQLVISGRVTDPDGDPVAGVLVRADADLPRDVLYEDDRDDTNDVATPPLARALREELATTARQVEATRLTLMLRRETRTDSDGGYELTGLYDVDYDVEALLRNWAIEADQRAVAWDARPGSTVDFHALRLAPVTVHVLDEHGRPLEEASVFASDDPEDDPFTYEYLSRLFTWTPANRTIHVPPGERTFRARRGPLSSATVRRSVAAGDEITLRVAPAARLAVPVVFADDAPDAHWIEFTARLEGVEDVSVSGKFSSDDSRVDFGTVTVGEWEVFATAWGAARLGSTTARPSESGEGAEPLHVGAPAAESGFRIVVLGPDGAPAADAEVEMRAAGSSELEPVVYRTGPGGWRAVRTVVPHDDEFRVVAGIDGSSVAANVPAPPHGGPGAALSRAI